MTVDEVAAELYALAPGDFIAARNAAALKARDAGDLELAAAVRALRRPTASAALLNALARDQPAALEKLLDIGTQLQDALDSGVGEDIRAATKARQHEVSALLREVGRIGAERGTPVSLAVQREIQSTLIAAMTDAGLAAAVRRATLSTAAELGGLGGDAPRTSEAPAAAAALHAVPSASRGQTAAAKRTAATTSTAATAKAKAAAAKRAQRERAKQAARERTQREAATRKAEAELATIDERLAAANQRVDQLRQERAGAVLRLAEARRALMRLV